MPQFPPDDLCRGCRKDHKSFRFAVFLRTRTIEVIGWLDVTRTHRRANATDFGSAFSTVANGAAPYEQKPLIVNSVIVRFVQRLSCSRKHLGGIL